MKNNSTQQLPVLILCNTLALLLCGIPAILTAPIPSTVLTSAFYYSALLSQNFLFSCMLGLLVLPLFLWISSDFFLFLFLLLPESFALFFSYMNAKVFAFWRVYVNHSILALYFSKGGGSQVFEVNNAMYVWISVSVLVAVLVGALVLLLSRLLCKSFHPKKWLYGLVVLYAVSQGVFILLCINDNMKIAQYSIKIPYFYDLSIVNALQKMNISALPKHALPEQLQTTLKKNAKLHYPLHPLQYHVPVHPLNVLIIVIDTLRYDMINPMNMPNVYLFAQHADQFLNNTSGGDCTCPGIFSLFYSIPATYWYSALHYQQESIVMQAFQANHYQFGLFGSASLLSPPFEHTVFSKIKNLRTITPGNSAIQRDIKITEEMQDFLNKEANNHHPFFGFIFYDGPHAYNALPLHKPFYPTQSLNYFYINSSTQRIPIFNLYKNAVFFDDQLIERVLRTLAKDDLYKNTVVIITSDHGQEFNDEHNDYWEHASGFSKYQVRTPMIIAWPHQFPHLYTYHTTHFDLAPTLLKRVLGVTNVTNDYSVGSDFFSPQQPGFAIVGNYAYFALLMPDKIMQFHNSGLYQFTTLRMQPLSTVQLNTAQRENLLMQMRSYYAN